MLAEEARAENSTMRELTERSYRDAVAIKILTIATLIYLPATVVSVRAWGSLQVDQNQLTSNRISFQLSLSVKLQHQGAHQPSLLSPRIGGYSRLHPCP